MECPQPVAMARARAAALWLRVDLRLDDNEALRAAATGETLLPVFVFEREKFNRPTLAGARKSSARRARFLLESVDCLRRNLERAGSGLAVAMGRPEEVLPELCQGCLVTVTKGFCSEEQREEHLVGKRLKASGSELRSLWGGTLYMPEDCGQDPAATPLLFTSFRNKAI